MFLDKELKSIRERKDGMRLVAELRRHLVLVEVRSFGPRMRRIMSDLTFGLSVAEQIMGLWRGRGRSRR